MKLYIGIPTGDFGRYNDFNNCLENLVKPEGTIIRRVTGGSIAKNRNNIIRLAAQEQCSHILFLDDDMVFEPDLIVRLLSHDKPVVSAHCLIRYPPFKSSIILGVNFNNDLIFHDVKGQSGLINVWATGLACTLIDCSILTNFSEYTSIGWLHSDELSEDISFFLRLHEAGFDSYCDLDCHVGHHINSIIWPDGKIKVNEQEIGEANVVSLRR